MYISKITNESLTKVNKKVSINNDSIPKEYVLFIFYFSRIRKLEFQNTLKNFTEIICIYILTLHRKTFSVILFSIYKYIYKHLRSKFVSNNWKK